MHSAIQQLFEPEIKDPGGLQARRSLPHAAHRLVGPFIFFDHLGPATFPPGRGVDVKPHPHVNLATVAYLTETLHAIQTWVTLPDEPEDTELAFQHYPAEALPQWETAEARIKLIMGHCCGYRSPVQTFSPTFYLDIQLKAGANFELPGEYSERAIYSLTPGIVLDDQPLEQHRLAVLAEGKTITLRTQVEARCVVIGGEPVGDGMKWWNFVSSRPQRIKLAKKDWKEKQGALL